MGWKLSDSKLSLSRTITNTREALAFLHFFFFSAHPLLLLVLSATYGHTQEIGKGIKVWRCIPPIIQECGAAAVSNKPNYQRGRSLFGRIFVLTDIAF